MSPLLTASLAAALAMDSFAVSCAVAASLGAPTRRQTLRLASGFGLFQLLMPPAGWLAGGFLRAVIGGVDHWVAFGLLSFVGGRMLLGSFAPGSARGGGSRDPTRGLSLLALSVATSIDALAAGLSLSLIGAGIIVPALAIGAAAFAMTAAGMRLGQLPGRLFGRRVEGAAGLVLIAIGLNILLGHLAG